MLMYNDAASIPLLHTSTTIYCFIVLPFPWFLLRSYVHDSVGFTHHCFPFLPTTSLKPGRCQRSKSGCELRSSFDPTFCGCRDPILMRMLLRKFVDPFFCSRNLSWSSRLRNRKPIMKLPATKIQKDYRELFWSIRQFFLHMDPGSEHGSFMFLQTEDLKRIQNVHTVWSFCV